MKEDYVKRFLTKDGKTRISIYREEYAENPRETTDEPLHCEDWSRKYSIMNKHERDTKSDNACKLIRYMLERYGNTKEIFNVLFENAKSKKHNEGDNAIVYDKSRHEWIINYWIEPWKDYNGAVRGNCWSEEVSFQCKLKNITAWDVVSYLSDEQVEVFADHKYFTDGIKMMSYGFGCNGEVYFDDNFSTDSEGICWLEKDEFLKHSGCKEEYWKGKTLKEIEFLIGAIKAWGDNDVYGFVVEDAVRIQGIKIYYNGEREDEPYIDTQWEETDSCFGFYDKLDNMLKNAIDCVGGSIDDYKEV